MLLSINQLSELTGRDRRALTKLLRDLPKIAGPKSAHQFESKDALALIYGGGNLESARAKQALSHAALNAVCPPPLPIQQSLDESEIIETRVRGNSDVLRGKTHHSSNSPACSCVLDQVAVTSYRLPFAGSNRTSRKNCTIAPNSWTKIPAKNGQNQFSTARL